MLGRLVGSLLGPGPTLLGPGFGGQRRRPRRSALEVVSVPELERRAVEDEEAIALSLLARRRRRVVRIEREG